MAASPPPSPPLLDPTTIAALSGDILLEIFLRLPDITSLARATFACRAFLRAVRSSPAFRRRFRQLRAPPLIALFMPLDMQAIVPAAAGKGADIAAAFNGLLQDSDDASKWWSDPDVSYSRGYANFFNPATDQRASYSPHSQALNIYPKNIRNGIDAFLEFHTLSHDSEEQRPSQVVCVHRDRAWAWARVAVFSAHNMEWQVVLPEMETGRLLVGNERYKLGRAGRVVNGFVCWVYTTEGGGCILALNTATFQFFRMEVPPPLKVQLQMFQFQLGHTKDGKFCVVSVLQCMLSVWLWETDSDGVERFMLHKTISLRANVSEITKRSEEAGVTMQPRAVINGFVFLSLTVTTYAFSPEWFLSFCLETAKLNLLHKEGLHIGCSFDPYIMVRWPPSLIHGKDSETRVTGNISEDDGHMCAEETSSVLFTALQSFRVKLIDDGNSKFAEIESFLLDDEKNSLLNRITILESGLAAARDCVLRIGTEPNNMSEMEIVTSESELAAARDRLLRIVAAARDRVLRIDAESDSMEEMERVSCWQMCMGMLGRVCSRFFTG